MRKQSDRRKKRRYSIGHPTILDLRLSIFSHALGTTRTALAEQWIHERLVDREDWENVKLLLYQEAEIRRIPIAALLFEVLEEDGKSTGLDLSQVDLSILIKNLPQVEATEHPEV